MSKNLVFTLVRVWVQLSPLIDITVLGVVGSCSLNFPHSTAKGFLRVPGSVDFLSVASCPPCFLLLLCSEWYLGPHGSFPKTEH